MIRVIYYAGVRERVGTFETRIEGFSGTLAGLLKHLEEHHGISPIDSTKPENANILSVLIFLINGRHVAHIGGLDAPVCEGDIVSIFPVIGGG